MTASVNIAKATQLDFINACTLIIYRQNAITSFDQSWEWEWGSASCPG